MDLEDAKVIRENYERLVNTMQAQNLLGYLFQESALSDNDREVIYAMATSRKENGMLLSILKKRKNGLKMLIKALLVTEVQDFLGFELLEKVSWNEKEMETFNLELEGKIDQQQMLEADKASLKRKNSQLEARIGALETELESLKQSLLDKTSKQEEETSKTSQQNHYGLGARRYAISFKVGGREMLKLEMLKREIEDRIEKIKERASPASLQEEYRHELRARRNAMSYAGGRASYLADVKDLQKKPQTVRQN